MYQCICDRSIITIIIIIVKGLSVPNPHTIIMSCQCEKDAQTYHITTIRAWFRIVYIRLTILATVAS